MNTSAASAAVAPTSSGRVDATSTSTSSSVPVANAANTNASQTNVVESNGSAGGRLSYAQVAQHHKDRLQKPTTAANGPHNVVVQPTDPPAQTAPSSSSVASAQVATAQHQTTSAPIVTAAALVASGGSWTTNTLNRGGGGATSVGALSATSTVSDSLDHPRHAEKENKRKDASPTNVSAGPGRN